MAKRPPTSTTAPERRQKPLQPRGAARVITEDTTASDEGLVEHPDGWYWVAADGRQQFGPFSSMLLARADRDRASEEAVDEAETEREAEQDLGVYDAIHSDADSPSDSDHGSRPDY